MLIRKTVLGLLAALPLVAACGGGVAAGALDPTFPDNRAADLSEVLGRLSQSPPADGAGVAVGLSDGKLFAYDLARGAIAWERPVEGLASAPMVAGDVVVTQEAAGITGRRLTDGERLFRLENPNLSLTGAGGQGNDVVLVLSTGGGVGARSRVLAYRGATRAWEIGVDSAVGGPAVAAGLAFLPWATQNLSIVDLADGHEVARLRATDAVLGRALTAAGAVYAGQRGLFRVTGEMVHGTREQAAFFEHSLRDLPGNPIFMVDPYQPPPRADSALHRIGVRWYPGGEGAELAPANGLVYYVFYKLVFAFDAQSGEVRWVHLHDEDLVGFEARADGLLVADAGGGLALLGAADGRPVFRAATGQASVVVTLRGGDFASAGTAEGPEQTLVGQLAGAAQSNDARLVPARILAIQQLAALDDPEVPAELVVICEANLVPGPVREAACAGMGSGGAGREALLDALDRHAAFLEGTTAPPVGALARALAGLREREAVPLLLAHLRDPATSERDIGVIAQALAQIGDTSAAEPLAEFLRLYHADADSDDMVAALGAVAEAVVTLQGPVAEEVLQEVYEDPLGEERVRGHASAALGRLADQVVEEAEEESAQQAADEAAAEQAAQDARPERITNAIVARVLAPVEDELQTCLRADSRHPVSARVVLVLDGDGQLERISSMPESVLPCIEPHVRAQTFPGNRRGRREQITYTIRR